MAYSERGKTPIPSSTDSRSVARHDSNNSRFTHKRSASLNSSPQRNDGQSSAIQMSDYLSQFRKVELGQQNEGTVENSAGINDHLLRSGQLGMCNDPYCTTCPSYYHPYGQKKTSKYSDKYEHKYRNTISSGETKSWAKRTASFLCSFSPPVMNPHTKFIQQWNQFFVFSCVFSIFIDPLFFFLLTIQEDYKCIALNQTLKTTLMVLRSCTDFIYLLHLLLQFRIAYVAPESRVVGVGDLVDDPKKIALNYLSGYFWIDLFLVAPIPQIIIIFLDSHDSISSSSANEAKNLLRAGILFQYIPKLYKFIPFLAGQSPTGFIFESGWANFVINMTSFILAGHVVGSTWYLFGLQRVNQCLRKACRHSGIQNCIKDFTDCGDGTDYSKFLSKPMWQQWNSSTEAIACFDSTGGSFKYGIYVNAVKLTTERNVATKYIYSLFWGFQQISTLAGNQVPSYYVWEVLFTMLIIGLGLLLFALLIGNMQNFLQSLFRRQLELTLRRRDVEKWMSHRHLPIHLRKKVRQAERYNWAATIGVNEVMLLQNFPEDLQQEIRRHLFEFIKKVHIFAELDEPTLDYIRERLRQTTYIKDNNIFYPGGFVDKMVFIVRGKAESIGEDGIRKPLSENVCGEELLTWCQEHTSVNRGNKLVSKRRVRCLTNVEAFVLRVDDIKQVTSLFPRFLRSPRVQGVIR